MDDNEKIALAASFTGLGLVAWKLHKLTKRYNHLEQHYGKMCDLVAKYGDMMVQSYTDEIFQGIAENYE